MPKPPENKEDWLKLLKQISIPSFGRNIKLLSSDESYSKKHSSELARTILKDPNLTASVLKLANSAQFNTYGKVIRTISRSIMVLGHRSIKEVCASCLLIDSFSKLNSSESLKLILARSFHAATQAKQIALLKGQKGTEEIFISALLLGLGEIAVYSLPGGQGELYQKLADAYPLTGGEERDLIGCYFNDLTLGLCESWNIAPMVGDMIHGRYAEDSPARSILLGNSFALSCESYGVNSAIEKHVKSISSYTGKPPELVSDKVAAATEETHKSLHQLGLKLDVKQPLVITASEQVLPHQVNIDKILQLDILQELSTVEPEAPDINLVLQQLLEGIQRGAGFSCALIALLNPDRSRLIAKYAVERESSSVKENFNFSCYNDVPEIVQKVMTNRKIILVNTLRPQGLTFRQMVKRLGHDNGLWGPLVVESKVIGCFYADNGLKGPEINQQQQEAFELFVSQARLLLQQLK